MLGVRKRGCMVFIPNCICLERFGFILGEFVRPMVAIVADVVDQTNLIFRRSVPKKVLLVILIPCLTSAK